jgi:hypothetical protein
MPPPKAPYAPILPNIVSLAEDSAMIGGKQFMKISP